MESHDQDLSAARSGDWLEVRGVSDSPSRRGEIVEVLGTPGHPHFLVRWDEGHESIVYPSDPGRLCIIRRQREGSIGVSVCPRPVAGMRSVGRHVSGSDTPESHC